MKHEYDAPAFGRPHDEWNSTDIADHARRAMHLETVDYGDCCTGGCEQGRTCPRRTVGYTATRLVLILPLVAIGALFVAALVFAGGIF